MSLIAPALTPGRTAAPNWSLTATLRAELAALDNRPAALLALRGWGTTEPALRGIGSFTELRRLVHTTTDFDQQDAILLALARLASIYGADDALAAQVLLALMTRGLAANCRRMYDLDCDPTGDEIEQALAAELAIRIRTWRGRRAVAANLVRSSSRDLLGRLLRERSRPDSWAQRTSLDTSELGDYLARTWADVNADHAELVAARDVVDWIVRSGLIRADDVALVSARRLYGLTDHELAAAFGVPRNTLQRRCQRAAHRVAAAVAEAAPLSC